MPGHWDFLEVTMGSSAQPGLKLPGLNLHQSQGRAEDCSQDTKVRNRFRKKSLNPGNLKSPWCLPNPHPHSHWRTWWWQMTCKLRERATWQGSPVQTPQSLMSPQCHVFWKSLNQQLNNCLPSGRERARNRKEGKATRSLFLQHCSLQEGGRGWASPEQNFRQVNTTALQLQEATNHRNHKGPGNQCPGTSAPTVALK